MYIPNAAKYRIVIMILMRIMTESLKSMRTTLRFARIEGKNKTMTTGRIRLLT